MPEIFDLKKVLTRTPEEIEADEQAQKEAEKRLGSKIAQSPAASNYRFALGLEKDAREYLKKRPNSDARKHKYYLQRLAESLFLQGKFAEAAAVHPVEAEKQSFERYYQAAENLDAPLCECPPVVFKSETSAKGTSVSPRREVQTVYSQPRDLEISFIFCEQCKNLFAQTI